ncbi:MAG: ion transporter [Chromatiales bacterium]|nr:ion transporter [Chromatiales bacterium]
MTRKRTWEMLSAASAGDRPSRFVDMAIIALIVANVAAVIVGSIPDVEAAWAGPLWAFEVFSVTVFTLEYLLRLWSCAEDPRFAGPRGRWRFAARPMQIIDLLAIVPFYLPFLGVDARVARIFRLFRLIRILKIARYSRAFRMIGRVFVSRREELVLTSITLVFLLLISATLMYYAEHDAQPEAFSSIPATLWWAVVTLTTVGYGDTYPITLLGKVFGGLIASIGIGMVALPAGIISSGFVEQIERRRESPYTQTCPHCGKSLAEATESPDYR